MAMNAVKEEYVQVEETDDSCRFEYFEIVPLTRHTDHTYACVSGDWSAEVNQENLTVVKQESDDVRCVLCVIFNLSQKNDLILADQSSKLFRSFLKCSCYPKHLSV